jgi:hypothetical protein
MRGAGGERGPDLTTVAARLRAGPFGALLDHHPGWKFTVGEAPGPQGAEELWSFLRAVAATNGLRPEPVTADVGAAEPNAP